MTHLDKKSETKRYLSSPVIIFDHLAQLESIINISGTGDLDRCKKVELYYLHFRVIIKMNNDFETNYHRNWLY